MPQQQMPPQQMPQQLTPQQQQMWLQRQQAQRFALAPRMTRMPMNGPMQPQMQPVQSPMHPSMGGMPVPHDPNKVIMSSNTNTSTELVSTSITAVVGGGIDTVIATSAPGVPAMVANQQVHLVSTSSVSITRSDGSPPQATSQAVLATKTILVSAQTPNHISANQGYQVSIAPPGSSVNSSSSNSPSSSSSGATSSVVNEKTKTALANLLNNRLNQQNGQQQLQGSNTNLVLRATSATVTEPRDQANVVASSGGKPLLSSNVVSQQQTHQSGKPTALQAPPQVVGVRPQQMMATGSPTSAANSVRLDRIVLARFTCDSLNESKLDRPKQMHSNARSRDIARFSNSSSPSLFWFFGLDRLLPTSLASHCLCLSACALLYDYDYYIIIICVTDKKPL